MVSNGAAGGQKPNWPLVNPWPPLIAGLFLVGIALVVPFSARFYFVLAGMISLGAAVSLRLSFGGWKELEDRATSAGVLSLTALAALISYFALDTPDHAWDSIQLVLGVAIAVSLGGGLLVLLPPLARRLAITVLALVHFGGIVTAVTSVPPPNGPAPYLVTAAWTYFYRHYLQFMYLNNAYHFYSPDPGPPSLLWFAVKYEKGAPRWIMLPAREQYRTRQDYQRYLALGEYTNMINPATPPPSIFRDMWEARVKAGFNLNVPPAPEEVLPRNFQFRWPMPFSQHNIAAYARYVARHFPSNVPDDRVEWVQVYRVAHNILRPEEMAAGRNPLGLETYLPFYLGRFNPDGELINIQGRKIKGVPLFDGRGNLLQEGDPFLYWAMPMGWAPKPGYVDQPGRPVLEPSPRTHVPVDSTDQHAGFSKRQSEAVYGPSPGH